MASFLKNFKNLTQPFADDDDYIEGDEEELEDEYEEEEEEEYEEPAPRAGFGKRSAPAPKAKEYQREYVEPRRAPAPAPRASSRPEVHTFAPASFDEVRDIAQNLLDRRAVILNLEDTDPDATGRLLDFMSGVAFALDGQIRRIAKQVYAFAPAGVDFIGFSVDDGDAESDGLYI